MPELPEVETVKLGLEKLIIGKSISSVTSDTEKSFPNTPADVSRFLVGSSVVAIKRRAKVLIIELDSKYSLVIHLKMTGQLVYLGKRESPVSNHQSPASMSDSRRVTSDSASVERFGAGHPNDSLIGDLPDKSTRVVLTFADESCLYFNDQRKFGWVKLLPTVEVPFIDFMKKVGPEPLDAAFTPIVFAERLQRRKNSTIKAALLDQTVLAGIGNIYADESLWGAKIHPETRVKNIGQEQLNTLFDQIQYMLRLAIKKGGSSDKNYVNAEGKRGSYLDFARVFRREGASCPRCRDVIIKTRVAGRGTHVCPTCQKAV
jgi:formamidopyrimidine-DNA glycosylase